MKFFVYAALALWCLAQSTVAQSVDPTQLAAWQAIFDQTAGSSWTRCSGKRESPCTCEGTVQAKVECVNEGGVLFIKSIRLRNNNLAAANVPVDPINTVLGGYSGFTTVDMSQNTRLRNTQGGCLNIPNCAGKTCTFDFRVCASTGAPSTPTSPPPTAAPTVSSLVAWRRLFDSTAGASWLKCKNTRTTPCECQKNQPADASVRVLCTGSTITRVSLIANNLVATEFPAADVSALILAGATYVDLSNNTAMGASAECFNVPECENSGVTCQFSKPICSVTVPPAETPSPTPEDTTQAPSTAPVAVTQTPSASTSTPSTTSPTTGAPSTASPTTGSPSTVTPSVSRSPTTPTVSVPPTTQAPNTAAPVTSAPSPATTTRSPTSVTSSPTQIQIQTPSPTQSAAINLNGLLSSVFVCVLASFVLM